MKLEEEVIRAVKALKNHGVVAFPTETVMGLGVLFNDFEAYQKLNNIKRRPEEKPYTLMVKSVNDLEKYGVINEVTQRVIDAFMPGSITILVPVRENSVPNYVTHNTNVIGMRVPTNKEALALLEQVDVPLLVPSANRSGEKPALNSEKVKEIFGDEVDFVISGSAQNEMPSTIVDLTKGKVKVVREGPISERDITRAVQGHLEY